MNKIRDDVTLGGGLGGGAGQTTEADVVKWLSKP